MDINYVTSVSSYLEEIAKENKKMLFRGEKEYYDSSLPSFYRESDTFKRIGINKYVEFVFAYIKHSQHLSNELPFADIQNMSDIEKQHILQHYEMPTQLLDVSKNPLIALFFACVDKFGEIYESDGYVKMYEKQVVPYRIYITESDNHHTAFKMPSGSIRAKVQSGDVIYFAKDEDLVPTRTLRIPSNCKSKIISELDMLGICFETMFPSLKNEMSRLKMEYEAINSNFSEGASQLNGSINANINPKIIKNVTESILLDGKRNQNSNLIDSFTNLLATSDEFDAILNDLNSSKSTSTYIKKFEELSKSLSDSYTQKKFQTISSDLSNNINLEQSKVFGDSWQKLVNEMCYAEDKI